MVRSKIKHGLGRGAFTFLSGVLAILRISDYVHCKLMYICTLSTESSINQRYWFSCYLKLFDIHQIGLIMLANGKCCCLPIQQMILMMLYYIATGAINS